MAGRPAKYNNAEELEVAIEDYFNPIAEDTSLGINIKIERQKVTVSGLAYHLGFTDRQSLYDYGEKDEFSCIIKRARLRSTTGTPNTLQNLVKSHFSLSIIFKSAGEPPKAVYPILWVVN